MRRRNPTLADIAAHCGVSESTASKALSLRVYPMDEATRRDVLHAAAELGYIADPQRRARARRHTGTVGLVYGSRMPNFFGIQQVALIWLVNRLRELELDLLMVPILIDAEGLPRLGSTPIDACVALVEVPDELGRVIADTALPVVVINGHWRGASCNLLPDDAHGMHLAVDHLVDLGHRHLIFHQWVEGTHHPSYAIRESAFLTWCQNRSVLGTVAHQLGDQVISDIRSRRTPATAVICGNDHDALCCLAACQRFGLAVPQEISLVAFNDLPHLGEVNPPLTAVAIPIHALAIAAADALAAICLGQDHLLSPQQFPETLTIRQSTAPPRKG